MLGFSSVPSSSTWWSDSACMGSSMHLDWGEQKRVSQFTRFTQPDAAVHVLLLLVSYSCGSPWCGCLPSNSELMQTCVLFLAHAADPDIAASSVRMLIEL